MRVQPLGLGEADRRRGERREARCVAADERAAFEEIENPETGRETGAAGGRKIAPPGVW